MTIFRKSVLTGAFLSVVTFGSSPTVADESVVQQDMTPIASQPGVGGRVLAWVNAGLPLTVLGHDGEWVRIASPQLGFAGQDLWIPAARLGTIDRGQVQSVLRDVTPSSDVTPSGQALSRFRIVAGVATDTGSAATTRVVTAPAARNDSSNHDSDISRSMSSPREAATSNPAVSSSGSPTGGSAPSTTAAASTGGTTPSTSDATSAAEGNPTPAMGNPTPAMGNPTPAMGNPTPAMGNPTPAGGNAVSGFGNPNLSTP